MFKTEISEFKGHKTICIVDSYDRRVISFGVNKAKAIIACIDHIRDFVDNSKSDTIDLSSLSEEQKKVIMQFIKE
jgi:hypothetical protein